MLSGSNTYKGGTIVPDGTFVIANNEAVEGGTGLYVGSDLVAFGMIRPRKTVRSRPRWCPSQARWQLCRRAGRFGCGGASAKAAIFERHIAPAALIAARPASA